MSAGQTCLLVYGDLCSGLEPTRGCLECLGNCESFLGRKSGFLSFIEQILDVLMGIIKLARNRAKYKIPELYFKAL